MINKQQSKIQSKLVRLCKLDGKMDTHYFFLLDQYKYQFIWSLITKI